jgi:predicted metal-dependent phosphoesterase TrpH
MTGPGRVSGVAYVDLHCHTKASFDSLADPGAVMRAAVARGLTHLAITDHDRIDGAAAARAAAPPGLTVIVGQEVKTTEGDLVCVFLSEAIPSGLSPAEAIAAAREQGGLVGIPHPFDQYRGSLARSVGLEAIAPLVDWVEVHNARIMVGDGNERALEFARATGLPGVAVSDAHTVLEIGVASTKMLGDPSTADGLRAALRTVEVLPGRATYFVRLVTPVAKVVQRLRGRGRERPVVRARPGDDDAGRDEVSNAGVGR